MHVQLTESQAREHPLYGVKGWLLALLIFLIVWFFASLFSAAAFEGRDTLSVQLVLSLFLAYDIARKKKGLAVATLCAYPGLTIIGIVFLLVLVSIGSKIMIDTLQLQDVLFGAVLLLLVRDIPITLYVFRSRRVNVTMRHRVRPTDPCLVKGGRPIPRSVARQAKPEYVQREEERRPQEEHPGNCRGDGDGTQQAILTTAGRIQPSSLEPEHIRAARMAKRRIQQKRDNSSIMVKELRRLVRSLRWKKNGHDAQKSSSSAQDIAATVILSTQMRSFQRSK